MENIFNQLFIHVHVTANSTDYIIAIANPNDSTNSQLLSEDGMVSSTYNFLIEKNHQPFRFSTHPVNSLSIIIYSKGLHLEEETREAIKKIKKEISDLGTNFGSNLNEDTTYVLFTEEELKGVPEDLVKSFEKVSR